MFMLELLMEHVLLFPHNLLLLFLELFEAHDQSLEGLLVGLLQHKIFDGRIGLFIIHELN